ncbi:hypothetical protein Poli38472_009323 [Pythium oligandrum]|uniref:Transmembrane protein n=1 Tax=Pythium oligandrum TaxID=41045 RepID=A0A8K1CM15_PYTOL|nr:hypothetical protein Poli38472_009323 [Pythium oligandrum]|eukprot:TMW65156.1 hypothetical protein Poli38472_009323 [Pythium oligandrum]
MPLEPVKVTIEDQPGSSRSLDDHHNARYVAGSQFFNHRRAGAIRNGGPVKLFSSDYCGVLISGAFSSLVYQMLRDCLQYLLVYLQVSAETRTTAERLVESTAIFGFVIGYLSDCTPILGYHRKTYMLLGWAWACMLSLAMLIHTQADDKVMSTYIFIGFAAMASFGTMIAYVACEIYLVELSQQETIEERGTIVAMYTIARITGQASGRVMSRIMNASNTIGSIRWGFVALFAFSLIPPLCVINFLEEPLATRPAMSWKLGSRQFWQIVQQRVVRYIITFICVYSAFSNIRMKDADNAIVSWLALQPSGEFMGRVVRDLAGITASAIWVVWFLNRPWVQFFAVGPLFNAFPAALLAILVATHSLRAQWFYYGMQIFGGVAEGVFRLAYLIPLVEICDIGSEGQTVGMVLSFDKLLATITRTISSEAFLSANWSLTPSLVNADNANAHNKVVVMTSVGNGLKLLALLGLIFLPTQKLDAQQLRAYGGFSSIGGAVIIVFFVVCFVSVTVLNLTVYF